MSSPIDISNVALAMVGSLPIVNFTDDSKSARSCKSLYPVCLEETMDLPYDWKFLTTRQQLSQLTDAPAFGGYDYQYSLPDNARRVLAQVNVDSDDIEYRWRRETFFKSGRHYDVILTNEPTCYIKFIRQVDDSAKYPGWFTKMIYLSMASKLSEPLKQNRLLALDFVAMWQLAVDEAKAANGLEDVDVNAENVNVDDGNTEVINAAVNEQGTVITQRRIR
jgi:hypothetical protein